MGGVRPAGRDREVGAGGFVAGGVGAFTVAQGEVVHFLTQLAGYPHVQGHRGNIAKVTLTVILTLSVSLC